MRAKTFAEIIHLKALQNANESASSACKLH